VFFHIQRRVASHEKRERTAWGYEKPSSGAGGPIKGYNKVRFIERLRGTAEDSVGKLIWGFRREDLSKRRDMMRKTYANAYRAK